MFRSEATEATYLFAYNYSEDDVMIVRRDEYVFVQVKSNSKTYAKLYLFKGDKIVLRNTIYTLALTKEQMEHDLELCVKQYEQFIEKLKKAIENVY